jgi:hypothetical protein
VKTLILSFICAVIAAFRYRVPRAQSSDYSVSRDLHDAKARENALAEIE